MGFMFIPDDSGLAYFARCCMRVSVKFSICLIVKAETKLTFSSFENQDGLHVFCKVC